MDTLFLISSSFISEDEIIAEVKKIAAEFGLTYVKESDLDYINIQLCDAYREGYFEVMFDGEETFSESLQDSTTPEGYGIIGFCDYDADSYPFIDFLKQLMDKYPEILVFYEYPQKGIPYYTYNKEQLEVFSGGSPYAFLTKSSSGDNLA